MTANIIYQKYAGALLAAFDEDGALHGQAVALALRLAVQDAYAAGQETGNDLAAIIAAQDKALQNALDQVDQLREERTVQPDQRQHEHLQAQISRLNEWLEQYAPALYHNPDLDTAAAVLTEIDLLRQQLVVMDADNADLTARLNERHTNGNGANPTTTPDWNRNHPAWAALPAADLGVIDQLSSGLTTFRRLNRTLRRDLVLRVIRHLTAVHGEIKISAFDTQKPAWMATAGAVVMLSETGRWPGLVAMALEPATA